MLRNFRRLVLYRLNRYFFVVLFFGLFFFFFFFYKPFYAYTLFHLIFFVFSTVSRLPSRGGDMALCIHFSFLFFFFFFRCPRPPRISVAHASSRSGLVAEVTSSSGPLGGSSSLENPFDSVVTRSCGGVIASYLSSS